MAGNRVVWEFVLRRERVSLGFVWGMERRARFCFWKVPELTKMPDEQCEIT